MSTVLLSTQTPVAEGTLVVPDQWIIDRVLKKLGRPKDLHRVHVHSLWGEKYRVNVYREMDRSGALPRVEMTDSYFVTVHEGELTAEPLIERKY